jgi:hypothetical protein
MVKSANQKNLPSGNTSISAKPCYYMRCSRRLPKYTTTCLSGAL